MIFYGSTLWHDSVPSGSSVVIKDLKPPAIVHEKGMLISGSDGNFLNVKQLLFDDGRMILASKFGQQNDKKVDLELNEEESEMQNTILNIWKVGRWLLFLIAVTFTFTRS